MYLWNLFDIFDKTCQLATLISNIFGSASWIDGDICYFIHNGEHKFSTINSVVCEFVLFFSTIVMFKLIELDDSQTTVFHLIRSLTKDLNTNFYLKTYFTVNASTFLKIIKWFCDVYWFEVYYYCSR